MRAKCTYLQIPQSNIKMYTLNMYKLLYVNQSSIKRLLKAARTGPFSKRTEESAPEKVAEIVCSLKIAYANKLNNPERISMEM